MGFSLFGMEHPKREEGEKMISFLIMLFIMVGKTGGRGGWTRL